MKILFIVIAFILASSTTFAQDKPIKGPIFSHYGPVYKIDNRSVPLPKDFVYKAVFDIRDSAKTPKQLNRNLESVARFINMHALNGVAMKQMQLAVVVHGKATKDLLKDTEYQKKFAMDNPNLELESVLRSKGVKFYLCGQSMTFSGYKKEQLEHPEDLALSAMTMFVVLQQQGYQLIP